MVSSQSSPATASLNSSSSLSKLRIFFFNSAVSTSNPNYTLKITMPNIFNENEPADLSPALKGEGSRLGGEKVSWAIVVILILMHKKQKLSSRQYVMIMRY